MGPKIWKKELTRQEAAKTETVNKGKTKESILLENGSHCSA